MQLRRAKIWATACLFVGWGIGMSPVLSQETPPPPRILGAIGERSGRRASG